MLLERANIKTKVDLPWLLFLLIGITEFGLLTTFVDIDTTLAIKGLIGGYLLLAGTLFNWLLVGFNVDTFFSLKEFTDNSMLIIVSLVAVAMLNSATSMIGLYATQMSGALFVMLIGISEEAFFRGFLLTALMRFTGIPIAAIGVSSIIGTVYHGSIYGTNPGALIIVFGSFVVLGMTYMFSGYRLSIPMAGHVIINLLAFMS